MIKQCVLLSVFFMFFSINVQAQSSAFYDGFDEGTMFSYELWSTFYGEDCYNFMLFRNDVQQQLIGGEYAPKSNDNWSVKMRKMGGRKGCEQFVAGIEEQCLNTNMCDQMGEAVAIEVIEDFCFVQQTGQATITNECAVVAADRCKGAMYNELTKWLEAGIPCPTISDNIDNLSFSQLRGMKDQCPDKVQELLR